MALTARTSNYRFAMGKQPAEGSALAVPTYEMSLEGGSIEPTNVESEYNAVDTEELPSGIYIAQVGGQGDPVIFGDCEIFGYLWFQFLGAVAKSGSTPNFVNSITRAAGPLFATAYMMRPGVGAGAGAWERQVDAFVQKIELTASQGQYPKITLTIASKSPRAAAATPTPATDRRVKASGTQMLTYIGGTFKVDPASQAPAQIRNLDNIAISAEWVGAQWVFTDALEAGYLDRGELRLGCSFDAVLTDYNWLNQTFFGTATPGADAQASSTVLLGAVDLQFERAAVAADANRNARIQLGYTRMHATPPKPAQQGQAVKISLAGTAVAPAAGEPITVTSKSGVDGTTW